jgi:hypothetical protein
MSGGIVAEKKQCQVPVRQKLEDAPNIGQEAHVAHSVRFVQHQHLHARKIDTAVASQAQQTARTGDDDFGTAP